MATFIIYSLLSIILLINVNKCRGTHSEPCQESDYPVCATNGTHWYFFKNSCLLNDENEDREDYGLPKLNSTDISNCFKECDQMCTDEVVPICAKTDADVHKTFSNRCELDLENCRLRNIWEICHEGECPSTATPINNSSNVLPIPNPQSQQHLPLVESLTISGSNEQIYPQPQTQPIPELIGYPIQQPNIQPRAHPQSQQKTQPLVQTLKIPGPNEQINPLPQVQPIPEQNEPNIQPHPQFQQQSLPIVQTLTIPGPKEEIFPQPQVQPVSDQNEYPSKQPQIQPRPYPLTSKQPHPLVQTLPIPGPNKHIYPQSSFQPHLNFQPHPMLRPFQHSRLGQHQIYQIRSPQNLPLPSPQPNAQQIHRSNGQTLAYSQRLLHTNVLPLRHPITQITHPQPESQHLPLYQLTKNLVPQPSQKPHVQDLQPASIQETCAEPCEQLNHQLIPHPINRRCPTHCSLEYDPVCATFEGVEQTFDNQCYMRADICGSHRAWLLKHTGECTEPESERCNHNCPRIYSPMCATFNGQNKTFSNECTLDEEICISGNLWDILYHGECRNNIQNCPTICPNVYIPVCASYNGIQKEFPNQCFVLIESCRLREDWKIVHQGPCQQVNVPYPSPTPNDPTKNCPDVCPTIYDPVCGTLGGSNRTFSNGCELSIVICKTGQAWSLLGSGQCETMTPNAQPPNTLTPSIQPTFNYLPIALPPNLQPPSDQSTFDQLPPVLPSIAKPPSEHPIPSNNSSNLLCPICSDSYKPVCGFLNGEQQTFNNECLMLSENCYSNTSKWVFGYEGKCNAVETPRNCPNICPLNYDPVCATFSGMRRTFPNECELNHEAYKTNNQWVIINLGECDYCPVCSDDIALVCAELRGQTRTFDNVCKVEAENCRTNSGWKIVSKTACEIRNCPKSCPRIYIPICAISNGEARTFGNICEMRKESCNTNTAWNIASKGECPGPNENCPQSCSLQYNPVCAVYQGVSKEFINECFLRSEICKTHTNWEFINAGPCSDQKPKQVSTTEPSVTATIIATPGSNDCRINKCLTFRDPVCATFNGEEKTFSNACFLNNFKCKTGEDWKIIKHERCVTTSTPLISTAPKYD